MKGLRIKGNLLSSFYFLPLEKQCALYINTCYGDNESLWRVGGEVSLPLQPARHKMVRRVENCLHRAQLQALAQETWARLHCRGAEILQGIPGEAALI